LIFYLIIEYSVLTGDMNSDNITSQYFTNLTIIVLGGESMNTACVAKSSSNPIAFMLASAVKPQNEIVSRLQVSQRDSRSDKQFGYSRMHSRHNRS